MTKKFLIVLEGQGDIDVRVANAAAKQWIESPPHPKKTGWTEQVPAAVSEGYDLTDSGESQAFVTIGSFGNDRALQCPGKQFSSVRAAKKHCATKGYEIIDTYHGMIY